MFVVGVADLGIERTKKVNAFTKPIAPIRDISDRDETMLGWIEFRLVEEIGEFVVALMQITDDKRFACHSNDLGKEWRARQVSMLHFLGRSRGELAIVRRAQKLDQNIPGLSSSRILATILFLARLVILTCLPIQTAPLCWVAQTTAPIGGSGEAS